MKKEFQIEVVCEGLLGSIFLGASKLPGSAHAGRDELLWQRRMGCILYRRREETLASLLGSGGSDYYFF